MFFPQDFNSGEAANVLADAAGFRRFEAQEADVVENLVAEGIVRVKAALVAGDRESRATGDVLAGVAYVVEECALHILGKLFAKQLANEPIVGDGLALRKLSYR